MNFKKIFCFKELDSHFMIHLFGLRFMFNHKCLFKYKPATSCGINQNFRSPKLIVSLTSFPQRINTAHLAINTLLRQTVKCDVLILWLARNQFPNGEKDLPESLLKLKDLGLTIDFCEDLKSYKKLIPSLKKYPNDIIVTADDDLYYEEDWLESLYGAYLKNPNNIYVRRAARIEVGKNSLKTISNRKLLYTNHFEASNKNLLLSGSGCLFPPNSLHKDIFNVEKIKSLLPTQDDFYFYAMAVLNRKKIGVVKGFDAHLHYIEGTQEHGLSGVS